MRSLPCQQLAAWGAALLVVLSTMAALAALDLGATPVRATPTEHGGPHYLPMLDSRGYLQPFGFRGARLTGMEGFGYSTILIQERSGLPNNAQVRLMKRYIEDVILTESLQPRRSLALPLRNEQAITLGRYVAIVWTDHPAGVAVYSDWPSGAATVYEAPPADKELILPLVVRNVYSHTTILRTQNTDDSDEQNLVRYEIFNNLTGALDVSLQSKMKPLAVVEYDTWFDDFLFGQMPINAAGGSIASLRVRAEKPVALLAFGDEMAGDGTSAYVARPRSAASTEQYLPVVRANYLGDSLIAIANASMTRPVEVTVLYRGHEFGQGAGRGAQFQQQFTISARGAAYIDLAGRGRGNQPVPPLPRGTGLNRGFFGQAVIRASGPVLAAVQEEVRLNDRVLALAAYNALGPEDLSPMIAVPQVHHLPGGRSTRLVLMNPGSSSAEAVLAFRSLQDGRALGSSRIGIPAGGSALVAAGGSRPTLPNLPEASQLVATSTHPLAAVVYDTVLWEPGEWGRWGQDTTAYPAFGLLADYTPPPTSTPTPTHPPTDTPTATNTPAPTNTRPPELPFRLFMPANLLYPDL